MVVVARLFDGADAHGFHHPISNEQDFSFENIVEQKYPTLPTKFISKHWRQLAEDLTHKSGSETVPTCDPKCYQNPENGKWLSCDDLVRILCASHHILTSKRKYLCPSDIDFMQYIGICASQIPTHPHTNTGQIPSGYACSSLEANICPGKCNHCICSCEQTCKDGRSCTEWVSCFAF